MNKQIGYNTFCGIRQ